MHDCERNSEVPTVVVFVRFVFIPPSHRAVSDNISSNYTPNSPILS